MGLLKSSAQMLLLEGVRRPFSGWVMQLGRQDLNFTAEDLIRYAGEVRVAIVPKPTDPFSDLDFFTSLGLAAHSLDSSERDNPTFLVDLNGALPLPLAGHYDVVFDGGTLEHVFHLPNALRCIFDLLKVGGRVIHHSPVHNWVDHGFYCFGPTFFWDCYTANHWEINTLKLMRYAVPWQHNSDAAVTDYTPGSLDAKCVGGMGGDLYSVFVVATKTEQSTAGVWPQQSFYSR